MRIPYDVAVIGAGIVGCAVARAFTLAGARVAILEKSQELLDGASKANSAILHTGFDAPPGSLELQCVQAGYRIYTEIREHMGLPLDRSGAMVLAWSEEQAAQLPGFLAQAHGNGVPTVRQISGSEALELEPELARHIRGALLVPDEALIDPWTAGHAYMLQAVLNGAEIFYGAEVLAGRREAGIWHLDTTSETVAARLVINAAGLFGDRVEEKLLGASHFRIMPRKGQFVVFDKPAARHLEHILLPVPTKITKGIVVTRTVFGNILVGPTAEEQEDRLNAAMDSQTLTMLQEKAGEILPVLAEEEISAIYAGLRPGSDDKAYRVRTADGYIVLGGIRSTGLSASLGLAEHALSLAAKMGFEWAELDDPLWPAMPMLAEREVRDFACPGNGGVVCQCERVTAREIEAALSGPLPARSWAGLKRRTRAGMGRCQGFYCAERLAEMTQGRLAVPLAGEEK